MIVSELNEQKRESLLEAFQQQGKYFVWYYTHKDNLSSIKALGFLSRNEVNRRGLQPTNHSDTEVQLARQQGGIHDHVNFYFTARTTTAFALLRDYPQYYRNLKFIRISLKDILMDDSITSFRFTNGNAASIYTNTYTEAGYIESLPWELIREPYRPFSRREGALRSSEVLIKPHVKFYSNTKEFDPPTF